MSDWLSVALHDDEAQVRTANTNRAEIAVKHRVERRFARYMSNAKSEMERNARLSAIDEELRLLANEVAVEYSAPEPDKLYMAALKRAYDFGAPYQTVQQGTPEHGYSTVSCEQCGQPAAVGTPCPKCGHVNQPGEQPSANGAPGGLRNRLQPMAAEVPADGYDRRTVDADEIIGTTPASSSGESFKVKNLDSERNDSKAFPGETQDIEDHGTHRDKLTDPKIERDTERVDVTKGIGKEQVGPGTSTFGDSSNAADPVAAGSASKLGAWHILGT